LRIIIALILVAAVGGVGYLVLVEGDGPGKGNRSRERGDTPGHTNGSKPGQPPPPSPLPDIARSAQANPFTADTQKELAAFVQECRGRGAEAVPLLLQLLAKGEDRKLQPRWNFRKGSLEGFPTLRSAYLTALRSIEGDEATFAMREVMKELRTAGESFLLAQELRTRGAGGWTDDLLRTALSNVTPAALSLRREMVRLAAESDPEGMATALIREIPRGESKEDGRLVSGALRVLPVQIALSAATPLLTDDDVTYRAKGNLIRTMLNRPESEVFSTMREEVLRGGYDEQLRVAVAYAAANSQSFFTDAAELAVARANKDTAKADAIQRRFEQRIHAAEELVSAALDLDIESSSDMRAAAMRRTLAAHRSKLEGK